MHSAVQTTPANGVFVAKGKNHELHAVGEPPKWLRDGYAGFWPEPGVLRIDDLHFIHAFVEYIHEEPAVTRNGDSISSGFGKDHGTQLTDPVQITAVRIEDTLCFIISALTPNIRAVLQDFRTNRLRLSAFGPHFEAAGASAEG